MHRPRFYRSPRPNFSHDPNFRPRGSFPGPYRPRYPRFEQQQNSNEEHWCETCDRAFPTVAKLEEHKQQHQKCNIDGCQFTAHPNMVTKHIQMQHATGLYKKIGNLNKPEDITKWREERKKRYPTKTNVDNKAAEVKEKIERGEKMGLKPERFPNQLNYQSHGTKGQKRNHSFGRENQDSQKNNTRNNQAKKTRRKFPIKKPDIDIAQSENNGKLKPFAGIQQIVDFYDVAEEVEESNYLIEEDDIDNYAPVKTTEEENTSQNICSAISTLICNYGSSDDDNLEENESMVKNNIKVKNDSDQNTNEVSTIRPETSQIDIAKVENITEVAEDYDSGPEEVKVVKTTINENDSTEPSSSSKYDEKQKSGQNINARPKLEPQKRKQFHNVQRKPKLPSTLIYKLLHGEIRQERNIVLQCVRHVVRNNFFEQNK